MKNIFFTKYSRPNRVFEKLDPEYLVEVRGFRSAEVRIRELMMAGQRLIESRNALYDFNGDIDENFSDPTRSPNYDLADASQDAKVVNNRLKAQKASQDAQKASQDAQKGSQDAQDKPSV